jgi:sulfatase-like protein
VPRLDALLEALDPRRPLFLVVNLMSAHAPWEPVPDDVGWVPARTQQSQAEARRILDTSTSPDERDALLRWRTDLYDYGVSRADDGVRGVFAALRARDRLPPGSRVVIVSDHGEFLGEHGRIDHAEELYEPQQRVPLVVWGIAPLRFPEPVSGMVVYGLLRDGRLPSELAPVVATQARRHDAWSDGLADPPRASAAQWTDTGKHILVGDAAVHFDLSTDPHELSGRPIDDGDRAAVDLRSALAAVRGAGRETSADLTKTLRALGYVE